ncbi:hypothetical protein ACFPM0_06195 [Pseudonocardia sulfidoxydans]|uniref:hypothetical protein n=1 Tax=Pseudonocardia sulfidoxydans TaxID=54011 RepID=UPI003605F92E
MGQDVERDRHGGRLRPCRRDAGAGPWSTGSRYLRLGEITQRLNGCAPAHGRR